MKIQSSDVSFSSSHVATSYTEKTETLKAWSGQQRPDFERTGDRLRQSPIISSSTVQLSGAAIAAQTAATESSAGVQQISTDANLDPSLRLIKDLIERMTGRQIHLLSSSDLASGGSADIQQNASAGNSGTTAATTTANGRSGWGLEYDSHQSYTETEQTSFTASGTITTADNKKIEFNISVDLQRSYHEDTSTSVRLGDAKKVDPLVLNFAGDSAQLTEQKFAFDLNGDGKKENISFVQGSGFLALDRNNDGKINSGTELFGPGTGNGFSELSALDSDGNHWIDESDPAFQKLKIWTKDAAGNDQLQSLAQAHVGALYLGSTSTPFDLNNAQNKNLGQIRSSGVWLSDDGKSHTMQQVDLSV
ncbi:hypothetical protein ACO0LB_02335 [Undibacterium sp. SXout7W]|uniref:hypothetical protein n=1 Tax=Undibacterium sp. SXout7W TaxID=3413049 RepID=UPI003BF0305B